MKLQVSTEEARVLAYYGIQNFEQLRQVFIRTRDERLSRLYTQSVGLLYQLAPD
jgi:hypothetical protein